ncbi:MAG: hypothetical protein DI534_03340 [Leifsonia xyli]|nr:MAG: hypothetical protein DI534_03340 [Leifsonia xyli]
MNPNRNTRGTHSAPPVVVSSARRRRLRAPGIRGVLAAAVALSVGVGAAVVAAGGSYAYLNATASYGSGGTIASGNAALTLTRGTDPATSTLTIPDSVYEKMLPGDIVNQSLTLTNTGTTPLAVTASITSDGAWETRVAPGACPTVSGTQLSTAALTSSPTAYGASSLAAGAASAFCLQVVLPSSAPGGTMNTTLGYTVTFDGTQVAS